MHSFGSSKLFCLFASAVVVNSQTLNGDGDGTCDCQDDKNVVENSSILISSCDPNDQAFCNENCVNLHGSETTYLNDKCCVHAGKSASILAFEEDSKWIARLAEFNKCTGASVRLEYLPEGEDGMSEALKRDVGEDSKFNSGTTGGEGIFDAYIVQAPWLPPVVEGLENLSPRIRESAEFVRFLDINPASRSAVSFNGTVRALPLDSDYIAIGWRQDVFYKHGFDLAPPKTIEELADLAEELNGLDHNDDGEPDWGVCLTPQVNYFYSFVAPLLQSKLTDPNTRAQTGQNIFFDTDTFEPLIRGPGFRHGLEQYWRVIRASNCQDQLVKGEKCDRKKAFPTGRCAMVISMPGTLTSFLLPNGKRAPKDRIDEATGNILWSINDQPLGPGGTHWGRRAPFPGSHVVESWREEDRDEHGEPTLVSCSGAANKELCPLADSDGVNYAAFFAEGGESYALNGRQSKLSARDVMWDVFTWLSELPATQLPLSGQYRQSHLNENAKGELLAEGWPAQAVDDLFGVLGSYFRTEEEGGNPVQDLLMLGFPEYMSVLDEELHVKLLGVKVDSPKSAFFNTSDPSQSIDPLRDAEIFNTAYDEFIDSLGERWLAISRSMSGGVLGQLQRWRQSLSLPWKTKEELCSAAILIDAQGFKNLGCEAVVNFETLCQTQSEAVAQFDPQLCEQFFGTGGDSASLDLILAIMIPIILLFGIIVTYCIFVKQKEAGDSVWKVKASELDFIMVEGEDGKKEQRVIGMGGFGVVLLADYRGTLVAVKKVIPPNLRTSMGSRTSNDKRFKTWDPDSPADPEKGAVNPGLMSMGVHKIGMISLSNSGGSNSGGSNSGGSFDKTAFRQKRKYEQMKADFVVEMRQLAKLRHPNITTTMGAVLTQNEEPMLLMEYMENGALYSAIRNDTIALNSQEDLLTIAQDIAHGLRFLHSAGLVHGDLKTKNVLLDVNFRAKLSDFGLSSRGHGEIARGTPYWMAPELLKKESSNTIMSDIYAFGILLYELYSRKNPYEGEDYLETLCLVSDPAVSKRPPVPTICPLNIGALMKDCLQHHPENRPTAKEVDLVLQAEGTIQGRVFRIAAMNRDLVEENKQITSEQATQLRHFSCMSHEIRTPLNCVIGISSLLEEDETLGPTHANLIKMVMSSGKLLKKVVDDVLDFNKFLSGNAEIEIQRTNLQETLNNIINSMALSPIAERKKITFRTYFDSEIPQFHETDFRRLQQIFYNLLSNAVKFSEDGSHVDLRASIREERSGPTSENLPKLTLDVIDYGKGIEGSDFDKIFQPFQQTETGITSVDGGTGLGLAIVKQLVELLGGSISVDSKVGEWTKFMVKFPLTVALDDKQVVSSKLINSPILLLSGTVHESRCVIEACNYFNLKCIQSASFQEMETSVASVSKNNPLVCIIEEDLFDETAYQNLCKGSKVVLVTFGPKGIFDVGQVHYKSLTSLFPSVLMKELGSMVNDAKITSGGTGNKLKKAQAATFEGLKVLVAEDNVVNQKVMAKLLERLHVTDVTVVANGKLATESTLKENFDVIFMDMEMPVMDGLEACRIITSREGRPQKVIFLTAHTAAHAEASCKENGARSFLSKPCTISDLRDVLKKLDAG